MSRYSDEPAQFPLSHLTRDGSVVELVDYTPHVVIQGDERVHVAPLRMFHDVASGKLNWSQIEDGDDMISTIIGEWLSLVGKSEK